MTDKNKPRFAEAPKHGQPSGQNPDAVNEKYTTAIRPELLDVLKQLDEMPEEPEVSDEG